MQWARSIEGTNLCRQSTIYESPYKTTVKHR